MSEAYVVDTVRTPIGRYGGALSSVRTDDLAAIPIKALMARFPEFDPAEVDEVICWLTGYDAKGLHGQIARDVDYETFLAQSPAYHPNSALIQGVVWDQSGRAIDDVLVEAVDADGDVAASAFTYASAWDSGPQHGYFFLEVGPGDYTIRLSKAGYREGSVEDVVVTRRHGAAQVQDCDTWPMLIPARLRSRPIWRTIPSPWP